MEEYEKMGREEDMGRERCGEKRGEEEIERGEERGMQNIWKSNY